MGDRKDKFIGEMQGLARGNQNVYSRRLGKQAREQRGHPHKRIKVVQDKEKMLVMQKAGNLSFGGPRTTKGYAQKINQDGTQFRLSYLDWVSRGLMIDTGKTYVPDTIVEIGQHRF